MTDPLSGSVVARAIGPLIASLATLLTWLTAGTRVGPELATLISALVGICGLVFTVFYRRNLAILGAGARRKGSPERRAYDELRASLAGDNVAARLYTDWLARFLDAVDRFFGDAGTEGQRAFGLKKPAPLWTAPAFDRCLLLAFIYPIATIYLIWSISGHVGPAEAALGLAPNVAGWLRGSAFGALAVLSVAAWRAFVTTGRLRILWAMAGVAIGIAALVCLQGAFAGPIPGQFDGARFFNKSISIAATMAIAAAIAAAFTVTGAGVDPLFIARTGAGLVGATLTFTFADAGALAGASIGAGIGTAAALSVTGLKGQWRGVFLALFLATMIGSCLGAAELLSPLTVWRASGPLLLIQGLLTLLNVPFDWASLGLTRALLRRGLELGGWWPYLLALVDAAVAGLIIAALALTMVIGVQAFDDLAVHGGGKPALPLDALFDGIAKNPAAPEYWWVYALLLSSMIPSFINLAFGGASLLRGFPGLPSFILRFMPVKGAPLPWERGWMAFFLTGQNFVGAILGVTAVPVFAVVLIGFLMPTFGHYLLDIARAVAALDLPMQLWQIFAHML